MPDDRRDIEKLLPFYVNGTLDAEERTRIEALLETDAGLRDELAFLGAVREGVQQGAAASSPGELGLRRLLRDVRRERRRERFNRAWRPAIAAAAALVLVLQFAVIARLTSEPDGVFRPAGAAGEAHLQVTFEDTATEAEIRALLRGVGAEIVSGPSELGIYRLRVDPPPADDTAVEALLERLRSRGDVVSFVARETE